MVYPPPGTHHSPFPFIGTYDPVKVMDQVKFRWSGIKLGISSAKSNALIKKYLR